MPTYAELKETMRLAWLAYVTAIDDVERDGWSDEADRVAKQAHIDELYEAYKTARADVGGSY